MSEAIATDICVIGAGAGGLSVAAGAAQMGARVVLVEAAAMGGDCLNHGCVPSKALLAAAAAAANSALDGTQPWFRQSPPIAAASTSTTRAPICAAPAATERPPAPAPMTQISVAIASLITRAP